MTATWRAGPVALTGADGRVGLALQKRLADFPNEVRALDRSGDVAAACADAEVVVHLAGTLQPRLFDTYRGANLDTVLATVDALADSAVHRVVFLSFITADPKAANPYLRAKGQAEEALRSTRIPTVILRCGHICGPPDDPGPAAAALLARRGRVRLLGRGTQRLAPVYRGDVVEAVVHAALDPTTPVGTFEFCGPETMSAREFARRLNDRTARLLATPAPLTRRLPRVVPALSRPLVGVMLDDTAPVGEPQETAGLFGCRLHTLDEVWQGWAGSEARGES